MDLILSFLCALLTVQHVWTVPTNTTFNLLKDMRGSIHHVDSVEAEQRGKAVADGRLRADVLDSTEDMSLVDSWTSLEMRMSSSRDAGNVNLVHSLWTSEGKTSEKLSSDEFSHNYADSAGLRCYNCSYHQHGDAFEGLPSHNECLLDPGNGLIAVAHTTTVPRGLQAYCAVATLPDASNEDIIRLAIVDHPNLSGTCKQVDVSLLCYCDTDLCNGPKRQPDDASDVNTDLVHKTAETQNASSHSVLTFNETEIIPAEPEYTSKASAFKSCQFSILLALYFMRQNCLLLFKLH